MPLDPEISLGVQVPQPATGATNPLGMLNTFSEVQNRLNQNALFQQEFAARQRFGQIMYNAPDRATGLDMAAKDPQTAAFAGTWANSIGQAEKTMLDMANMREEMARKGAGAVYQAFGQSYGNPALAASLFNTAKSTMSPQTKAMIGSQVDDLAHSLVAGLDFSTPERAAASTEKYRTNALSVLMPTTTPEMGRALSGVPSQSVIQGPFGPGGGTAAVQIGGSVFGQPQAPGSIVGGSAGSGNNLVSGGSVPAGGLVGPSMVNSKFLESRGTDLADQVKQLDNVVNSGYSTMQVLSEAKSALQNFKPGAGAGLYAGVARVAQGLGADQDLVDKISNGNLAATQEFQKLMVQTVMGQIRDQLPTGSRLAQYEFKVFENRNPNIDTDPRAINKIFDFWEKLYNRHVDEQQSFNNFIAQPNANLMAWPAQWQRLAKERGYVGAEALPAGMAPPPPANAQTQAPTGGGTGNALSRPSASQFFR